MKIDKAIKFLEDDVTVLLLREEPDFTDAVKLGIEALKRVKEARQRVYFISRALLPGETNDR